MSLGPWQLIIIALVILVLFGRGRISEMMGDFGKGINSFKKGMNESAETPAKPAPQIEGSAKEPSPTPDAATAERSDSAN